MDEVGDWLLARHDPRLKISKDGTKAQIDNLNKCCADFCGFMAALERRGIPAKQWRDHLELMMPVERETN